MAGISRTFKDASNVTQNRSVTVAGGRDLSRWVPVDESDGFVDLGALLTAANNYAAAGNGYQSSMDSRLSTVTSQLTTLHNDFGTKTTSVAALGSGGSGVIGWLSQIWERLNALLPAALGQGTMAQSLRVVLASDQSAIQTVPSASAATGGVPNTDYLASSAASTNAANIKSSAGRVYSIQGLNKAAYDVYLVLYDTSGTPVPGTTAFKKKIPIPAFQPFALNFPNGIMFGSGIGRALVKNPAAADATAVASGDIVGLNVDYA